MSRSPWVLAVALLLCVGAARTLAQVPATAEARAERRAAIDAERSAAEAVYRTKLADCNTRFVVSSCVEAARKERHDTLKRLDSERTAIDDVEREERAQARRAAIAKKESEAAQREREAQAADAPASHAGARRLTAPRPLPELVPSDAKPPQSAQQRAADEARARSAYALKQLQAEARRQEAARRNAERAGKSKTAAPLPDPPDEAFAASAVRPASPASAASAR